MTRTAALLGPFFNVLFIILDVITWTVLVWVVLSWLAFFASQTSFRWRHKGAYHLLMQLNDILGRMAYPFLKPFRRFLRRFDTHGIDWSPMLLWLTIVLLRAILEGVYRLILFA